VDYFQGVVADYLNADPMISVKPECLIRLDREGPLVKGNHWYCDVLAVSFRQKTAYLCEVTLSQTVAALMRRLSEWEARWAEVSAAVVRDNLDGQPWSVRPWAFVPEAQRALLSARVASLLDETTGPRSMPRPVATSLEAVVPWRSIAPLVLPGEHDVEV
jgi:hypothetical protein